MNAARELSVPLAVAPGEEGGVVATGGAAAKPMGDPHALASRRLAEAIEEAAADGAPLTDDDVSLPDPAGTSLPTLFLAGTEDAAVAPETVRASAEAARLAQPTRVIIVAELKGEHCQLARDDGAAYTRALEGLAAVAGLE